MTISDDKLARHARHIAMPQMGMGGVHALIDAHVTVVGCGGLGSILASILAAAGVGSLRLVDPGNIELSNLPRQWVFHEEDCGRPKVDALATALKGNNSDVNIECVNRIFSRQDVEQTDIIADCTDNAASRQEIAYYTWASQKTLVSGAVVGLSGQLCVFKPNLGPCRACVFPENPSEEDSCTTMGVLNAAATSMAALQANQVIRELCGYGEPIYNRLWMVDFSDMTTQSITIKKNPHCKICGASS